LRLLLDTHCWLWFLLAPEKLSSEARRLLGSPQHETYLSVASVWEILLKFGIGKLSLPMPPSEYIPNRLALLGHISLPILQPHVLRLEALPSHHKDPFDRILVAQALVEGLQVVSADPAMVAYDVPLIWAGPGKP
jgi:PIN domain nuclease of toxin-antitoxin system